MSLFLDKPVHRNTQNKRLKMGTNDRYFQASYTTAYVIERVIFQQKIPFRHDVEQVALDVKYVQQMFRRDKCFTQNIIRIALSSEMLQPVPVFSLYLKFMYIC